MQTRGNEDISAYEGNTAVESVQTDDELSRDALAHDESAEVDEFQQLQGISVPWQTFGNL